MSGLLWEQSEGSGSVCVALHTSALMLVRVSRPASCMTPLWADRHRQTGRGRQQRRGEGETDHLLNVVKVVNCFSPGFPFFNILQMMEEQWYILLTEFIISAFFLLLSPFCHPTSLKFFYSSHLPTVYKFTCDRNTRIVLHCEQLLSEPVMWEWYKMFYICQHGKRCYPPWWCVWV